MPIINYKPFLIGKVKDGSKTHTIRFGKRIYKVGQTAIQATGMRTKNYQEHRRDEITSVEKIRIQLVNSTLKIWINNVELDVIQFKHLVNNDGFKYSRDFIQFFQTQYGSQFDITGQLIQWGTPIDYASI